MPTFGTRYQHQKLLNIQHVVLQDRGEQSQKKIGCLYLYGTILLMQAAESHIHRTGCLESLESHGDAGSLLFPVPTFFFFFFAR